jgi:hypothetical protein
MILKIETRTPDIPCSFPAGDRSGAESFPHTAGSNPVDLCRFG